MRNLDDDDDDGGGGGGGAEVTEALSRDRSWSDAPADVTEEEGSTSAVSGRPRRNSAQAGVAWKLFKASSVCQTEVLWGGRKLRVSKKRNVPSTS